METTEESDKSHKVKIYVFDGFEIRVPLCYDVQSGKYIEDYKQWIETPIFSPLGHPLMFSGEDSCEHSEGEDFESCPDCGSCRHYKRAAEHTWIGVCMHPNNRKSNMKEG